MKRRRFFQAVAAAPVVPAALAQQPSRPFGGAPAVEEGAKLEGTSTDAVGEAVARFFTAPQLSALRKLSGILMPPMNGAPGALEAGAPEFLDFLVSHSPAERQQIYRAGLDALNASAKKRYGKAFADVDAAQADVLLAPLREAFHPEQPTDPLARFLSEAKRDVRTATVNSREWAAANAGGGGGRRFGGSNLYWLPLD
jgi:hypothetical protein